MQVKQIKMKSKNKINIIILKIIIIVIVIFNVTVILMVLNLIALLRSVVLEVFCQFIEIATIKNFEILFVKPVVKELQKNHARQDSYHVL